ncbi:MAG: hypothetical protein ABSG38_14080 [Spirochaetia bacterium]|jgi:hypothetical protein
MDTHEAGKQRAEQFVTEIVRSLKQDGLVDAFLWWPEVLPEPGGPGDTTVPLRIYKGNSWRLIGFAGSDIDGSVDNPAVLKKYEDEVAQSLAELQL